MFSQLRVQIIEVQLIEVLLNANSINGVDFMSMHSPFFQTHFCTNYAFKKLIIMLLNSAPKFSLICSKLHSVVLQFCTKKICILYVCTIRVFSVFMNALLEYHATFFLLKLCTFCQNYQFQVITMLSLMICSFSGYYCTNICLLCQHNSLCFSLPIALQIMLA